MILMWEPKLRISGLEIIGKANTKIPEIISSYINMLFHSFLQPLI